MLFFIVVSCFSAIVFGIILQNEIKSAARGSGNGTYFGVFLMGSLAAYWIGDVWSGLFRDALSVLILIWLILRWRLASRSIQQ